MQQRSSPQETSAAATLDSPLVTLEGAGLSRNGRWLVRGIDLTVGRGEIVTLIGPNGSGKSTTAKIALGLHRPDEGRAFRRNGLKVGYVPQKLAIDWTLPLTVRRFMTLTKRLPARTVDAAMERVGASGLADFDLRTLSGGEFQRTLLARAIALQPDFLVLDEPVQGVDVAGEAAIYRLIEDIRETLGCGILLISHDLHMVMAAADTVICLNGHVCCRGAPEAVARDPAYHALFADRRGPAVAPYKHKEGGSTGSTHAR
ncbi:MAG: metal ABC transporter ATP-binding protein [Pseudomonadota bacterium]